MVSRKKTTNIKHTLKSEIIIIHGWEAVYTFFYFIFRKMSEPSNAGIIEVGDERWIPGSQRADGTYRKERKVRPGFVPIEDVKRYSNAVLDSNNKPASIPGGKKGIPGAKINEPAPKPVITKTPPSENQTKEKKIKALHKKLRQITDLEQKLIKGEQLNEEQRDKVRKAKTLRIELAKLEAQ
jgi:partner of Y14 and mago protein